MTQIPRRFAPRDEVPLARDSSPHLSPVARLHRLPSPFSASPCCSTKHRRAYLQGHRLDNPVRRKTGAAGVFPDGLGIGSVVLAVDLPLGVRHVTPDPHHSRHFGNHRIGQPPGGVSSSRDRGRHGSFGSDSGAFVAPFKVGAHRASGYFWRAAASSRGSPSSSARRARLGTHSRASFDRAVSHMRQGQSLQHRSPRPGDLPALASIVATLHRNRWRDRLHPVAEAHRSGRPGRFALRHAIA